MIYYPHNIKKRKENKMTAPRCETTRFYMEMYGNIGSLVSRLNDNMDLPDCDLVDIDGAAYLHRHAHAIVVVRSTSRGAHRDAYIRRCDLPESIRPYSLVSLLHLECNGFWKRNEIMWSCAPHDEFVILEYWLPGACPNWFLENRRRCLWGDERGGSVLDREEAERDRLMEAWRPDSN